MKNLIVILMVVTMVGFCVLFGAGALVQIMGMAGLDNIYGRPTFEEVTPEPNCEAWFESKGEGASLECPEAGVAVVIHGKNCRYALQNHKQLVLRCDNIELKGEIH